MLKKFYYKFFKRYQVLETQFVTWERGNLMLEDSKDKPEAQQWVLAKEEDTNRVIGMVYLCRKVRITQ